MAELSEYTAAIDAAMDRLCEEADFPRQLLDELVEADRAAMAPRWAAEAEMAEAFRRRQAVYGAAWEEAFRAAGQFTS